MQLQAPNKVASFRIEPNVTASDTRAWHKKTPSLVQHTEDLQQTDMCSNQVTAACPATWTLIFPVRESEEDIEPAMQPKEATSKTQPIDHWLRLKILSQANHQTPLAHAEWWLQCFHRDVQQTRKTCYVLMTNKSSQVKWLFNLRLATLQNPPVRVFPRVFLCKIPESMRWEGSSQCSI